MSSASESLGDARSSASCPLCGSGRSYGFLKREAVPVHQHLVLHSRADAKAVSRGNLDMRCCDDCGFVFNAAFDPGKLEYGLAYDNSQTFSSFFQGYMDDLVRHMVDTRGVKGSRVVEVGCGKGAFLRAIVEYPGSGNIGFGFDPSYDGPLLAADGRLSFRQEFFGPDSNEVGADVVVCRHVIEHVRNPLELLAAVRSGLGGKVGSRVFFETPSVDWILRNGVFWDFFYEHCSLFSEATLRLAFERAGFSVIEAREIFGGQYLWIEAEFADHVPPGGHAGSETPELARLFSASQPELLHRWRVKFSTLLDQGNLALWGAGAKGVTLANLLDPEGACVDCVVDLNPAKQGCFLPGTGHPIVAPRELSARNVRNAILMNPNYMQENQLLLKNAGIPLTLCE